MIIMIIIIRITMVTGIHISISSFFLIVRILTGGIRLLKVLRGMIG